MGFDYRSITCFHLFSVVLILHTPFVFSQAVNNTISQGLLIRDGQTIISPGRVFELGFFSPRNSTFRYVGVWYYRVPIQTVVWVANRENPVSDNSGVLSIGNNGDLIVSHGNSVVVWSTNSSSRSSGTNLTAVLLDNGNLILSSGNNVLWQSYDHPSDTFLPEMRIEMNPFGGANHSFFSWKSVSDPSNGSFSMGLDPRASPQVITWNGTQRIWRSGHWNRLIFIGIPRMRALLNYGFRITTEPGGNMYFTFQGVNSSTLMNFRMRPDGAVEQVVWDEGRTEWNVLLQEPADECGKYNRCGNFGICEMSRPGICSCVEGFVPNSTDQRSRENWSTGCNRRTPLQCVNGTNQTDGFVKVENVKLPDYADTPLVNTREGCEEGCLANCSCNAYAFISGIGCMTWGGDLVDVRRFEEGGETLYIRLANSELVASGRKSRVSAAAIITFSVVAALCLGVIMCVLWRFRQKLKECLISRWEDSQLNTTELGRSREVPTDCAGRNELSNEGEKCPLPLFSFTSVEIATEHFSNGNKLGEGGFGPVYKGTLPGGEQIAVKRLSKWSGQGLEEFKNELILIVKLQHRNLVRLLGCCMEREEKLLIYEYMPNKSLDSFLFDHAKKAQLDWRTRFKIIEGIARGLLYLHRDSRLRIIHRDLKVSNILLDEDMNPKISDFGMARIFGGNQNEANTNRVVGTYGYMSPEYAMEGLFSVKSDVYSFGVLLLEIVSGQRNNSFRTAECSNLIRYAWNLWKEGKAEELIDPSIMEACNTKEALQCIHVAMLCVQISALHRPTMASVMLMLESENASLPQPRQPDLTSMSAAEMDLFMEGHDVTVSSNDVTVTEVTGR